MNEQNLGKNFEGKIGGKSKIMHQESIMKKQNPGKNFEGIFGNSSN